MQVYLHDGFEEDGMMYSSEYAAAMDDAAAAGGYGEDVEGGEDDEEGGWFGELLAVPVDLNYPEAVSLCLCLLLVAQLLSQQLAAGGRGGTPQ